MLLWYLERTELCIVLWGVDHDFKVVSCERCCLGGGGGVRVETVHWDVVIRVMTRVLKDQWISITIASMSLIGLFWLELGVW